MADDDRVKIEGRQTLDFDLLNEDLRKKVIECISKRGKISVVVDDRGVVSGIGLTGSFRQLID
jgi:hypothetical protein